MKKKEPKITCPYIIEYCYRNGLGIYAASIKVFEFSKWTLYDKFSEEASRDLEYDRVIKTHSNEYEKARYRFRKTNL